MIRGVQESVTLLNDICYFEVLREKTGTNLEVFLQEFFQVWRLLQLLPVLPSDEVDVCLVGLHSRNILVKRGQLLP